ncbi:MAG: hypothetical protein KDD70_00410 [Bdellovibrionales bacterium]|nr:hypothetical protein [Bdellovibrionales bacterium]
MRHMIIFIGAIALALTSSVFAQNTTNNDGSTLERLAEEFARSEQERPDPLELAIEDLSWQLDIGFEAILDIPVRFRSATSRQSYLDRFSVFGDTTYQEPPGSGIATFFQGQYHPDCPPFGPYNDSDSTNAFGLRADLAYMFDIDGGLSTESSSWRVGPVLTLAVSFAQTASGDHDTFYSSETDWQNGVINDYIEHFGSASSELDLIIPRVTLGPRIEWRSAVDNGSWWTIGLQGGAGFAFPYGDLDVHGSVLRQGQNILQYEAFSYTDHDSGFRTVPVAEALLRVSYQEEDFGVTLFGGSLFWLGDATWSTPDVEANVFGSGENSWVVGVQGVFRF